MNEGGESKVLLLEVVNADQFPGRVSTIFPFVQGYLDLIGVESRWLRFGLRTTNLLANERDEVTFSPDEFAVISEAVDEFRPTTIITTDVLAHAQREQLLRHAPGVAMERDKSFSGLPGRPVFHGHDLLCDPSFSPRYDWEPGNDEARDKKSDNIYLLAFQRCGHRVRLSSNPLYKGIGDEALQNRQGCAFCSTWRDYTDKPKGAEDSPEESPEGWMLRQIQAIARSRKTPENFPNALLLEALPRPQVFDACLEALLDSGMAPYTQFLLAVRTSEIRRVASVFRQHLRDDPGSPIRFGVYATGVESFGAADLAVFNKGTTPLNGFQAVNELRALAEDHPERFWFTGVSFLFLTPWTTPESLHLNIGLIRLLGITRKLAGNMFQSRLRLHEGLPIRALAERDGLLEDEEEDGVVLTNRRKLFETERPWRFKDARMRPLARVILRYELLDNEALADDLSQDIARRLIAGSEGFEGVDDEHLLEFLLCKIDVVRATPEVLSVEELLDQAEELWAQRRADRTTGPRADRFRVGEERMQLGELLACLAPIVREALRPVLTVADVHVSQIDDALRTWIAAQGLHVGLVPEDGRPHTGLATLLVSGDEGRLVELQSLCVQAADEPDKERLRSISVRMGELLGLPACCAEAAVIDPTTVLGVDRWQAWAMRASVSGEVPVDNNPFLVPSASFVSCSPTCRAAAEKHAALCKALGIEMPRAQIFSLSDTGDGELVALDPTDEDVEGLRYEPTAVEGPNDPLRASLRKGSVIRALAGHLQIRGDDDGPIIDVFSGTHGLWSASRCWHAREWGELARGVAWTREHHTESASSPEEESPQARMDEAAVGFADWTRAILDRISELLRKRTGFTIDEVTPVAAREVRVALRSRDSRLLLFLFPSEFGDRAYASGKNLAVAHAPDTPPDTKPKAETLQLVLRALDRSIGRG